MMKVVSVPPGSSMTLAEAQAQAERQSIREAEQGKQFEAIVREWGVRYTLASLSVFLKEQLRYEDAYVDYTEVAEQLDTMLVDSIALDRLD